MSGWGEVLEAQEQPVVYTVGESGEKEAGVAGIKWAGGMGGGESRERTGKRSRTLWAAGKIWAFALGEVGATEVSECRRDII